MVRAGNLKLQWGVLAEHPVTQLHTRAWPVCWVRAPVVLGITGQVLVKIYIAKLGNKNLFHDL